MPTPDFNATGLPLPNYNLGGDNIIPVIRTEMESGRIRQRQRFSTELQRFSVEFSFTDEEFETFKEFWRDDLAGGSLSFTLTLPLGDDFDTILVRFPAQYRYNYAGYDHWRVSGSLERETTQEVPDPDFSPVPLWYRPELTITDDVTLEAHQRNILIKGAPDEEEEFIVTVPTIEGPGDWLPIGILNTGAGKIIVQPDDGSIVVPSDPVYIDEAYGAFLQADEYDLHTLNGASQVTSWADYKEVMPPFTSGSLGDAEKQVAPHPDFPCLKAKGSWICGNRTSAGQALIDGVPSSAAEDIGIIMAVRCFGTADYVRFIGNPQGGTAGFFMWPATTNPYIDLEKQSATTTLRTAVMPSLDNPTNDPALGRNKWFIIGFRLPVDAAAATTAVFLNGAKIANSIAPTVPNYEPPAPTYRGIGHTGLFYNFYIGDVCYYKNPTDAKMIEWQQSMMEAWGVE